MSFAKWGHGQREDNAIRGIGRIDTHTITSISQRGLATGSASMTGIQTTRPGSPLRFGHRALEWRNGFSGNSLTRKRTLKQFRCKIPARWVWKFAFLYLVRRGFLDGYPGFVYCVLQAFYDFLICLKIREIDSTTRSPEGTLHRSADSALDPRRQLESFVYGSPASFPTGDQRSDRRQGLA